MRPLIGIADSAPRWPAGWRSWRHRPCPGTRCRRADGLEPGGGAVVADRRGADDGRPALRTRGTTRCRRGGSRQRRRSRARHRARAIRASAHRTGGQPQGLQQHADAHRIGREHLAQQRDGRLCRCDRRAGRLHRALLGLLRAYFSIAPASTSLASAWVGTPKPGTSMPMMRTPLISSAAAAAARRRRSARRDW
jgi:hypothetical protein